MTTRSNWLLYSKETYYLLNYFTLRVDDTEIESEITNYRSKQLVNHVALTIVMIAFQLLLSFFTLIADHDINKLAVLNYSG